MIHNTDTIRKRFSSRIAPCPFFLGIARRRMWGAAPRPALAAVRLGGQSWRATPLSCPHSSGSGRSCRVKGSPRLARVLALRAAGRSSQPGPLRALDPPSADTPPRHQNGPIGENTENGKNRTLRLWHVRRSRAVLGLSVAVSGWSTAQPGVRRSGERASE